MGTGNGLINYNIHGKVWVVFELYYIYVFIISIVSI
jgi:hypothetical protein